MSDQALSKEENELLVQAIFAVFRLVAEADGTVDRKELGRLEQMLSTGAEQSHPLFRSVLRQSVEERESRVSDPGSSEADPLAVLKRAAEVLDARLQEEDARGFKAALVMFGKRISDASRGGVMGLGDKSAEKENRALAAIQSALGLTFL
jgi:tellurite resistance protein